MNCSAHFDEKQTENGEQMLIVHKCSLVGLSLFKSLHPKKQAQVIRNSETEYGPNFFFGYKFITLKMNPVPKTENENQNKK